ncbi:MAG: site-specific DNA-methyltransferase [Robiginitomaculum sp.]|nr:MAG: site-specific DNA-methyltransferase [Robiginitomaculum sp.]
MHADKGIGDPRLDGNLIIQGDNLHALKALLPMYAGKVDCIFIDPPYNTGNEGWCYNDNVNAPMIKTWLENNPIGIEDGLRHDKWCAMMWPRLRLLHELLADDGAIFISIDDNEQARLKAISDEIFGEENFVSSIVWEKRYSPQNAVKWFSESHDFVLIYARDKLNWYPNLLERSDEMNARYRNLDNDPRGVWKPADATAQAGHGTRSQFYELAAPNGKKHSLPNGRCWVYTEEVFQKMVAENRVWFGSDGNNVPAIKRFLSEVKQGTACQTIWKYNEVGHNQDAKKEIKDLFPEELAFDTPKPSTLIDRILQVGTDKNSIVLDSFSGSGTTAHSVIKANKRDGGNRKFILVEMEDYADSLTAERVRRVINGYDFTGTQKTELLRQKLSWTQLKKADALVKSVDGIENLHGHEYDKIAKTVKNGELIVTGETKIKDKAEGLGGAFTYCTLGPPVEMDKILTGETLPTYEGLGAVLFHTATNMPLDTSAVEKDAFYLGQSESRHVWLIYRPDLDWLKSPDAALTLSFARKIAAAKTDKPHLVFAPARYVSQKMLASENLAVEFAPLPFALYRVERE